MSPFQHCFTNLRSIPPCPIIAANNHTFFATGMGNLKINVPNGSSFTCITLKDTFYAPGITLTVVSIHKIACAGYKVSFEDNGCKIKNKEGKTIGKIPASPNGLYKVVHPITAAAVQEQLDFLTVHQRLGHISADAICSLVHTNAVTGLQSIDLSSSFTCNSCEYAKATCKVIQKEATYPQAEAFGDEIHTNLWGPVPVASLGGHKYYVTFTNDHTRYT